MNLTKKSIITVLLSAATCAGQLIGLTPVQAQSAQPTLWQIGTVDSDDKEFALAPNGSNQYKQDPIYVIGSSNPAVDWPYVLPGPIDGWAGNRQHVGSIYFNLASVGTGNATMSIYLVDTQGQMPPKIEVALNGNVQSFQTQVGGGDASISGTAAAGKHTKIDAIFPVSDLKAGLNNLTITSTQGSWLIYDALVMSAPTGTTVSTVSDFAQLQSAKWLHDVLVYRDGKFEQVLQLQCLNLGKQRTYSLYVSGEGQQTISLPVGKSTQEVYFPESSGSQMTSVSLSGDDLISSVPVMAERDPCKRYTIFEIEHSHMDIGYAYLQEEALRRHAQDIDDAFVQFGKTASYPSDDRFRWNCESLVETDLWLKRATSEQKAAFVQAVKNGDLGLTGLYCNELTGLCRPEELVALLADANKLRKEYGISIDSAMISDVPGYTWGMVPILAQSGIKYFSWGPNPNDHLGTARNWDNKAFYWVSPSGKDKVLVWQSNNGYQSDFWDAGTLVDFLDSYDQRFPNNPYDMIYDRHTINDNGPIDPNLPGFVKQWNSTYAYPHIIMATNSQMLHAFEAKYGKTLPEVHGDYTGYWEDGAASTAAETAINRNAAELTAQDEVLWSLTNPIAYPEAKFYDSWNNAVLYDEHTWGADQSWNNPESDFTRAQWAFKRNYALLAQSESEDLKESALRPIAPKSPSNCVAVFNTLSWTRSGLVILPAAESATGDVVVDETGKPVPSQRLSDGTLAFLALPTSPFSSYKYQIESGKSAGTGLAAATASGMTNSVSSLQFDPSNGSIASWKVNGVSQDLVNSSDPTCRGLNDYMYVLGEDNSKVTFSSNSKVTVLDNGPLVATVQVVSDAPGCNSLNRIYRLVDGSPDVYLADTLDKQQVRANEGVNIGFNFNVPNGVVHLDEPWSVVRPDVDQTLYANKSVYPAERWVDVSNGDSGVSCANLDNPMVQVGRITQPREDEGGWLDYAAPGSTIDWQLMNNYWHTNYKAYQSGVYTFRYVIQPHGAYDQTSAEKFGTEQSQPLIATSVDAISKDYRLPLRLSNDAIIVTAVHPLGDGKSWLVRLFNSSDKSQSVKLDWTGSANPSIESTDLFGNIHSPVTGLISMAPNEVSTYALKP